MSSDTEPNSPYSLKDIQQWAKKYFPNEFSFLPPASIMKMMAKNSSKKMLIGYIVKDQEQLDVWAHPNGQQPNIHVSYMTDKGHKITVDNLERVQLIRPFNYFADSGYQRLGEKIQILVLYYLLELKYYKQVQGLSKCLQRFRLAVGNIADGENALENQTPPSAYRAPVAKMKHDGLGSKDEPIDLDGLEQPSRSECKRKSETTDDHGSDAKRQRPENNQQQFGNFVHYMQNIERENQHLKAETATLQQTNKKLYGDLVTANRALVIAKTNISAKDQALESLGQTNNDLQQALTNLQTEAFALSASHTALTAQLKEARQNTTSDSLNTHKLYHDELDERSRTITALQADKVKLEMLAVEREEQHVSAMRDLVKRNQELQEMIEKNEEDTQKAKATLDELESLREKVKGFQGNPWRK
ncbi:hypothetical protein EJ04DRAFT_601898 [Polyplosphaeria fusca]|uniref:Uncharacterized protein n=1 Tax=Polyplosphaeria fusca TaxID=682080 RepID=A0A9P4R191_9PLEO|nr:hypothetical protein EJ04DRAFT_601898 [Polyplosphaeria fusca]